MWAPKTRGIKEKPRQSLLGWTSCAFGRSLLVRRSWSEQVLGAANERISAFIEAEGLIGGASNADSNGFTDRPGGALRRAEPECTASAKVEAVVSTVDLKGGGKTAGASRKIENPCGFAVLLHECDAIERFKGADENGCGGADGLTDDVQHEVRAVVEENVGVTGGQIHRAYARRRPTEMMARRIPGRIRFRFHDAAAHAPGGQIMDDHFADEEAREGNSVGRKFRAAKTADRGCWIALAHGENGLATGSAAGAGQ
jgi:hypothetical protein